MSNLPDGMRESEVDGPKCPQCGEFGCECEDDGDPRTYRERIEDEKGEMKMELERNV